MMAAACLRALLSHWQRHWGQLLMLLLGLSLATGLWTGVQAINAEARASYAQAAANLGGDRLVRVIAADGGTIAQADYIRLRRAGWQVSPVVEGDYLIGIVKVRLIGIDPLTLPAEAQATFGNMRQFLGSQFLGSAGQMFIAPDNAARLGHGLIGAEGIPEGVVMADIGVAQAALGMQGQISRLIQASVQPLGVPPMQDVVPGLIARAPDRAGDVSRLTDSFHLNLTAFGLLSFLVGLFIVQSAVGLAFEQRRGMVRTMRALGMPLPGLMAVLIGELVGLALVAGVIGVGLGFQVARMLMPGVAATLSGLYGAHVSGGLEFRAEWWLAGIGIAVLGTLFAASAHLVQLARMPILQTAGTVGRRDGIRRVLRAQAAVALACAVLAVCLMLWGRGLVAGFGVLAALFVGAASGLPVVLALVLRQAERRTGGGWGKKGGGLAHWFWADTRAGLPGLSLALMALMLAFATNIGVGTMVSSFRLTFVGWLDQRLASELYVTARTPAEAAAIRIWVQDHADAVLPISSVDITLFGAPAEVFGVADHATYRDNWPLLENAPQVWEQVAAGTGALINEQMHYRHHLNLGDMLALPGGWKVPVVGIYSDYGNPLMQVIVGNDALARRFTDINALRMGVRVAPDRVQPLAEELRNRFDLPVRNVVNQADIKALSLRIFERTFAVTGVLNVLTLGVAGIAMFASLMTLADMRLPQIAPVWAMGVTRTTLVRLEFARALLLAMLAMVAALPLGLGLAWVLLNIVNVEAFGWRLPMYLFPLDWLGLLGLGLVAAVLAAAVPVRKLARVAPSTLLKVFANAA